MNGSKEMNRIGARILLQNNNIEFESFNNDFHWKIGKIDFYPTTLNWIDNNRNYSSHGTLELVEYIKINLSPKRTENAKELSVQQIAKIFTKNQDKSLMEKCELLHKEIYD